MKPIVFIPDPIADSGMRLLLAKCECLAPWFDGATRGDLKSRELPSHVDAVVVRLFPIRAESLIHATRLKVIGKHGTGVDNIDCHAATLRRIPVVYTPAANANAVAEHTIALMLALARQIVPACRAMHEGRFEHRDQLEGIELVGKTLGIVGLGRIGSRVAEISGRGLGMMVRAYDPCLTGQRHLGPIVLDESLEALLSHADFLTFHVPLTPETRHLMNDDRLALLKPDCRMINTSRGAVIDEIALARALHEGLLAGAALDVFEQEPLSAGHPLLYAPHVLLTPHIGSSTRESLERVSEQVALGVLDVLRGDKPAYLANPEVWS